MRAHHLTIPFGLARSK